MFADGVIRARVVYLFFFLSVSAIAFSSGARPVGEDGVDYESARRVDLNTTFRAFHAGGELECFKAQVPRGILKLDVAVPGWASVEPRLVFHGQTDAATGEREAGFSLVEESAASMLLDIRTPGSYAFCLTGQDPRLDLGEYKLSTSFAVGCGLESGDPDEDEPDPDSLDFGCGLKGGDPDEDEPDPDSLAFGVAGVTEGGDRRDRRLRASLDEMCRSGKVDDHGDTFACATALDRPREVAGEVRNDWGDDVDVMAFMLAELRTVEIATTGETDTFGSLYDRSGHRLDTDDDGGRGENFRIAKTLAPGMYFVRVEGRDHSEGAYRLRVRVSRR